MTDFYNFEQPTPTQAENDAAKLAAAVSVDATKQPTPKPRARKAKP